jgi:hypothetical protein
MKHYLYISDEKVDMVLAQAKKLLSTTRSFELKLDLKLFSATYQQEIGSLDNRIQKLHRAEKYIRKHCEVGNLDNPKDFVADTMEMTWGIDKDDLPLMYICGYKSITVPPISICLGGSRGHIIGSHFAKDEEAISNHPSLIPIILKKSWDMIADDHSMSTEWLKYIDFEIRQNFLFGDRIKQRMEFLVKSLLPPPYTLPVLDGNLELARLYIGTPLYVALV